jgi:hypothetical protein
VSAHALWPTAALLGATLLAACAARPVTGPAVPPAWATEGVPAPAQTLPPRRTGADALGWSLADSQTR